MELEEREAHLVRMLEREDELRRSEQTQLAFEEAEASASTEWMDVVERLQEQVVSEFACYPPVNVNELRAAALRHPEVCFWIRHNRARCGSLRVGDAAPDVRCLRAVDGSATTLFNGCGGDQPTVVVAGSLS